MDVKAKWLRNAGILIGVVFVLYIMAPQEKLDHVSEAWLRLTNDPGESCLEYERKLLKDPDSSRLISESSKGDVTTIRYKAKNSYGAFDDAEAVCSILGGKVNEYSTQLTRENLRIDAHIQVLNLQNKCIELSIQRMRDGFPDPKNCDN
jgi:hypothetical protein